MLLRMIDASYILHNAPSAVLIVLNSSTAVLNIILIVCHVLRIPLLQHITTYVWCEHDDENGIDIPGPGIYEHAFLRERDERARGSSRVERLASVNLDGNTRCYAPLRTATDCSVFRTHWLGLRSGRREGMEQGGLRGRKHPNQNLSAIQWAIILYTSKYIGNRLTPTTTRVRNTTLHSS